MLSVVGLLASAPLHAAEGADGEPAPSRLIDPQDGWLDVSGFLDSVYGFVPVIVPITEPAVGYGAAGALVFIDRKPPDSQGRSQRPNITAVGGLRTENGTHGFFGGFSTTMRNKARVEEQGDRAHVIRVAMERMCREIDRKSVV